MEYPRFVRLRSPLWDRFEETLATARRGDDRLGYDELEEAAVHYRQVLHDHALATARFPATTAARRLRRLALDGTRLLTRERGAGRGGLLNFVLVTFPDTVRRHLPTLGVSCGLFLLLALFGLVATILRPGLGAQFVGQGAVDGLAEGRLWTEGLTTSLAPAAGSGIATNNLSVAFTAWAGGALAGVGALYVVLLNGAMLGAVVGLTLRYGMTGELLEFVAAHGPLEITIILVTAGAGLVMGRAVVEADDRPRGLAVRQAARDALVLLAGCAPWLLVLAVVEAFLSPSTAYPPAFKAGVGLALEVLFLTLAFNPMGWRRA